MKSLVKLNLARNCLKYIVKAYRIKQLFIPYFTCPVIWQVVREVGCSVRFYHIDESFLPTIDFNRDDYILYTNYFGLCDENCRFLEKKYSNLIVDNSQSFYSQNFGIATFNSLRKFFKVQNGAYLYIEKELDDKFANDELCFSFIPTMQENYEVFLKNELTLDKEKSIKRISKNVENQMTKIDFDRDVSFRKKYFNRYAEVFDKFNNIKIKKSNDFVPYCYPFSTSNEQIKNNLSLLKLPLLRLWKDLPKNFIESSIFNDVIALPLDDKKIADYILKKF